MPSIRLPRVRKRYIVLALALSIEITIGLLAYVGMTEQVRLAEIRSAERMQTISERSAAAAAQVDRLLTELRGSK